MEPNAKATADRINEILKMGKYAQSKEDQEKIIKMLSGLSTDYSSPEYPKMSISEFMKGNSEKAALSPKEMLQSYYGDNLAKEIIAAGNYNIARPVLLPKSYPAIFDTIQGSKTTDYGSSYTVGENVNPTAEVTVGKGAEIQNKNNQTYREWLNSDKPELKARALDYFKTNSLDPSIPRSNEQSTLEHEIGHHITRSASSGDLAINARSSAYKASDGFKEFGGHTGIEEETTQALGRFQREMFKNTGKRLHPVDFMELVNKGEIPDFLTQEGRRILIYAKNLKEVADKSKDKKKKEAAREALWNISRMAPAVVKNENKYGLKLPMA